MPSRAAAWARHWFAYWTGRGYRQAAIAAGAGVAALLALASLLGSSSATSALAVSALVWAGLTLSAARRAQTSAQPPAETMSDIDPTTGPTPSRSNAASLSVVADAAPDTHAESTWRRLLDVLGEAALAVDRDASVVHANPAARSLFPRLADGQPLAFAVRDPGLLEAVDDACRNATPRTVEVMVRVPFERLLTVDVAAMEPEDGSGSEPHPSGQPVVLLVLRDRSSQYRLIQMRADFIANASHELRTPLAALRGFIDTLLGPARDDEAARARFLPMMASQALRMSRLIDDLLLLSRIEERAHLPPRGNVDLGATISETIELLRPQAVAREATIHWRPPTSRIEVTGDRDELLQVIQNLVQNAIKYGRIGGSVQVTLEQLSDGRVELTVADDGPGISAEHLPRLTERFYRVSAAHSREIGGTGLGLAIVKHIVNRHGGDLSISSTVGKGATFRVRLNRHSDG
jgi:two-component system phosphate regulon sensor histidine kinase PhoR